MAAEEEVRKASEQFYTALNRMVNGDAGPLADIWSHSTAVTTSRPTATTSRRSVRSRAQ
jgi:hypothetical protein